MHDTYIHSHTYSTFICVFDWFIDDDDDDDDDDAAAAAAAVADDNVVGR